MSNVRDTAQFILETMGAMTTMKLQKLVYYSQVWSVVWYNDPLFDEPIEAWRNGPVVRGLWEATRGQFSLRYVPFGDSSNLTEQQRISVSAVLDFYGDKDARWLSELTHMEDPWREAYQQGQNTQISLDRIIDYYSSLPSDEVAEAEHQSVVRSHRAI